MLLRDYQLKAIAEFFASTCRRSVIVIPTGGGKTVVASEIIRHFLEQETDGGVLFLAHRKELLDQAKNKLAQFGVEAGTIRANSWGNPFARVNVASVQSLVNRTDKYQNIGLVVVDECHRSAASTYVKIADKYPTARFLGLTATPWRLDNKGLADHWDEIISPTSPALLIESGHLVEPRVYGADGPNLKGVKVTAGDYNQKQLAERMDKSKLVGDIVKHYDKLAPGSLAIAYAVGIEHATHICEQFRLAGHPSACVNGKMNEVERDSILAKFRAGEIKVIANCDILTEGYDFPELETVILARPTASVVKYLQMVGRVMRPSDGKTARVIDHAGCTSQHGFVADDREYSLEATKPKKKAENYVKVCKGCMAIIKSSATKCPECGYSPPVIARELNHVEGELVELQKGPQKPTVPHCRKCQSVRIQKQRIINTPRWLFLEKCLECGAKRWHSDKDVAKSATPSERLQEYIINRKKAEAAGHKPGVAYYRYLDVFGEKPPFRWANMSVLELENGHG